MKRNEIITFIVLIVSCIAVISSSLIAYDSVVEKHDDVAILKCNIPEPPSEEAYRNLNWIYKEVMLIDYSRELIRSNNDCSEKLSAMKDNNS